jgi:hypothetical protein
MQKAKSTTRNAFFAYISRAPYGEARAVDPAATDDQSSIAEASRGKP